MSRALVEGNVVSDTGSWIIRVAKHGVEGFQEFCFGAREWIDGLSCYVVSRCEALNFSKTMLKAVE